MAGDPRLRLVKDKGDVVRVDVPKDMLVAIELGMSVRLEEIAGSLRRERQRPELTHDTDRIVRLQTQWRKLDKLIQDWRTLEEELELASERDSA